MARPCGGAYRASSEAPPQKHSDAGYHPASDCGKKSRVNAIRNLSLGLVIVTFGFCAAGCGSHAGKTAGGRFPSYNVIRLYNDSPAEIYAIELDAGGLVTAID